MAKVPKEAIEDRLHSINEGAVQWINGKNYYFIHGVEFKLDLFKK